MSEQTIETKIDQNAAREIAISKSTGSLVFRNAVEAMEGARILARGDFAVPKHFRGNPGAVFAMIMQAQEWEMSPLAVMNKTYVVNDRLAYESQLVQAVILNRAPLKDGPNAHFDITFDGEGDRRTCRVAVELLNGDVVDYRSPPIGQIVPKNSPLWKTDSDQQLFYYAARALCRRHFPHVLLGVYAREELDPGVGPDRARDITPKQTIAEKLDDLATKAIDANTAMSEALDQALSPSPERAAVDNLKYELEHLEEKLKKARTEGLAEALRARRQAGEHVTLDVGPDAFEDDKPKAAVDEELDPFEPVRERARLDAAKGIKRLAPTMLSDAERSVYLQTFDLAKEEMKA